LSYIIHGRIGTSAFPYLRIEYMEQTLPQHSRHIEELEERRFVDGFARASSRQVLKHRVKKTQFIFRELGVDVHQRARLLAHLEK
jgi:hypothetical protein